MGSQGGKTIGSISQAFCRSGGKTSLGTAISNMYSANQESFIRKNPLSPTLSFQLFSTLHFLDEEEKYEKEHAEEHAPTSYETTIQLHLALMLELQ